MKWYMVMGKVKFNLYLPSKPREGEEVFLYCFFNRGTRWGWVVKTTLQLLYP
jgi:hypothetical protein